MNLSPTGPNEQALKPLPAVVCHQSLFPLPYFAHQELDPDYFPAEYGAPTMRAPSLDTTEDWNDDGHNGGAMEAQSEAESEDLGGPQIKANRSGMAKAKANGRRGSTSSRANVTGTRSAAPKRVTVDLNSDDELIVRMKEARYLEKDIAQALVDQGRTAYHPKTIGTRWKRIKSRLQQRHDELLDQDLTDWHDDDDEVLLRAIEKANFEIRRACKEVESRKWRMVADFMKKEKSVVEFSNNACRKRYEDILLGCAKPTPESIPNPTSEILERIESRRRKQKSIEDNITQRPAEQQNVQSNGWTSRQQRYF